ncbi:MAG: hypothetical protein HYY18_07205 [Planctomycetes bacterium]|nr:hypothetical protein [Planctomycetota bacterium]
MFTLDEAGVPRERSRVGQDRGPTFLPEIGIPIDLDCITKYNEEVQSLKNQLYSRFLHDREAAAKRLAEIAVVCPWAVIPLVSPMAAGYSARDLAQGISRKLIEKYYPCALYSAMIREELTSADGKFDAGRLIAGVRWLVDNGLPDWCRYQFPNADWGAIDDFRLILDEDVELTDDDLLTWARDLFGINPPPPGRD